MNQSAFYTSFYFFTPATINTLERWLSKKAEMGWRLEKVRGLKFIFRKCNPYKTQYVYYSGFGTNLGITHDYFLSKKQYAKNSSTINKSNSAIYEADITKIDVGFYSFLRLRNKFYLQHYVAMLLFAVILAFLSTILILTNAAFLSFFAVAVTIFAYASFSTIILIREIRQPTGLCSNDN